MSARFIKTNKGVAFHDKCIINGRAFDAEITVEERRNARSIHGGRITFFLLSEADAFGNDIAISHYDNGKWDICCPEEDDEACIAQNYFIEKWNKERNK